MSNESVVIVQVIGSETPDVDTTKMKGKPWNKWITDAEDEEEKKDDNSGDT